MPESGTSGSVRDRDGQPPGLLDRDCYREAYINEQAREKLQALWPVGYTSNMKKLIPAFAQQLHQGELPINGVKTAGKS